MAQRKEKEHVRVDTKSDDSDVDASSKVIRKLQDQMTRLEVKLDTSQAAMEHWKNEAQTATAHSQELKQKLDKLEESHMAELVEVHRRANSTSTKISRTVMNLIHGVWFTVGTAALVMALWRMSTGSDVVVALIGASMLCLLYWVLKLDQNDDPHSGQT